VQPSGGSSACGGEMVVDVVIVVPGGSSGARDDEECATAAAAATAAAEWHERLQERPASAAAVRSFCSRLVIDASLVTWVNWPVFAWASQPAGCCNLGE
jgi:hypothetical protein